MSGNRRPEAAKAHFEAFLRKHDAENAANRLVWRVKPLVEVDLDPGAEGETEPTGDIELE
jgi:hypothetical protein